MKKLLIVLSLTLISFTTYSQIHYEAGFFIKNSGEKINCLINNMDWKNNPTEFTYKLSENDKALTASIRTVKEFEVTGISNFKRFEVNMDRSSDAIATMNWNREPEFHLEELFLQTLVTGKASLYSYQESNLSRYFYQIDDATPEQLVYKSYFLSHDEIKKNNGYKQQLWNALQCETIVLKDVENLAYNKKKLSQFVMNYNECSNSDSKTYEVKEKKDLFNLSIRPGVRSASLVIENSLSNLKDTSFETVTNLRLGLELEIVLPFNKNKWALLFEPTYASYKTFVEEHNNNSIDVQYKTIEIPFGVRHYMFLSDKSKLFVNGAFVFSIGFDSLIDFEPAIDLEVGSGSNFAIGLGYEYNNRFSLEVRYALDRNILDNYVLWGSDYGSTDFIFGYTLF